MSVVAWFVVLAATVCATAASAQSSVSGAAELSVAQTQNTTNGDTNSNDEFWQSYSLGLHSNIFDPRVLKYDAEVTFRTNRLNAAGSAAADQHGRQDDLGFRLGAFVLPSGVMPFFAQASRTFSGANGELLFGNNVLGGLAPTGAPIAAFETEDRNLNLGARLVVPGLPRAEVSYRSGEQIVTGGAERAAQRHADISGSVTRETSRSRHALHYQRSGYDYVLTQAFSQRINNLDYDFVAAMPGHLQLTARAGQRDTFARSSLIAPPIDPGDKPYEPPPALDGRSGAQYANGGIAFEPGARFSMRLNGTWDQQRASATATSANLAVASVHAEVVRGLALHGEATSGRRGQIVAGDVRDVDVFNGVAGVTYNGGPRWLTATLSANTGRGLNETPEGLRGETRSLAREASLSSSIGWFGIGAGYEKVMSEDAILDYGNYLSEKRRGTLSIQSARIVLSGSADRLFTERGRGVTFADHRQDTFSGTLTGRLSRQFLLTAMAGGFRTTYLTLFNRGVDRSTFWGGGLQATMRSLHATAWVRSEDMYADSTHYSQRGLSGLARLEYQLRTLHFAAEYRHNDNSLQYGGAPAPTMFRGHQVRFSLTRLFAFGG